MKAPTFSTLILIAFFAFFAYWNSTTGRQGVADTVVAIAGIPQLPVDGRFPFTVAECVAVFIY
jgi:hypothetical protein